MENAADALLIAFAVLIFVIALSVSLNSLAQAKSTADIVLFYSDRENFQTPLPVNSDDFEDGGRLVGIDTVISTIARCAKEKFSVKIIDGTNDIYIFEYDIQSEEEIQLEIERFISSNNKGTSYRETYVEVTTSGTTYLGEDGTQLEENVGKKIYITFKKV